MSGANSSPNPAIGIPGSPGLAELAKSGAALAREIYPGLEAARATAAPGDLDAFGGLVVANQYRVPYGVSASLLSPGSRVLDWGCGDGHFSYFLLTAGHTVSAFSLQHEPHLLLRLPEPLRARYRYVQGDIHEPTRLPFPDSTFDAVFSIGVLEHVREEGGTELASLQEIRRVLRPTGLLIGCHLPNRYSWIETTTTAAHAFARTAKARHHEFRFRRRDVQELCDGAGLEILEIARYAFLPRNVLRRLPSILRNSRALTAAWNRADDMLAARFPVLCQNFLFVARPL